LAQFSDTTNKNGLIQKAEIVLGLGDAGISGNTILLQQFTGLINSAYEDIVGEILDFDRNWAWDDSNYTNVPRGVDDLVADQRDYTLPVAATSANAQTFLRLREISVLDAAGYEKKLIPASLSEADMNRIYRTSGLPLYYKLVSNSAKIWPAASAAGTTLTNGLIVYFQRTPDQFTSADTTQHPGIPQIFHPLIVYRASLVWATTNKPEAINQLTNLVRDGNERMSNFYQSHNLDQPNIITGRVRSSR